MMGSFRRPRPRFMSSPVLSDLARFHASSPALQISNTTVWNRVQSAVIKVFQGGALQTNELFTLNESIRWLLKTEMGSFITEYLQNQLLPRGLSEVLDHMALHSGDSGDDQLVVLADVWDQFFTETLPTLQAIFYPFQGQELTVRQMALLVFRDLVLLKLPLEETLGTAASIPRSVTQMLLVLQGIHESGVPSSEYQQLERLVEIVVSPYLGNVLHNRNGIVIESCHLRSSVSLLGDPSQPEITVSQHLSSLDSSSLSPLVEQEGEMYLEKVGDVRRHTVANAHSDVQLLSVSNMMHAGTEKDSTVGGQEGCMSTRPFSSEPDMVESPGGSRDNGHARRYKMENYRMRDKTTG
ncbi:proline-rich protein 5-like [Brachyistius frenatus]|uniref:proline-rich protein 5-like n=1 Tax=Brachyistius frenatus TaxID=100188 RepID=UPI0037E7C54A